jgi:hypothetical protein
MKFLKYDSQILKFWIFALDFSGQNSLFFSLQYVCGELTRVLLTHQIFSKIFKILELGWLRIMTKAKQT